MVVGIVLAAGGSRRMGRPKALLDWRGAPLVAGHVAALAAVCDRVRVVLGGHAPRVEEALPAGVEVVMNPRWAETGMSDSLALALEDLPEGAWALVTPVDLPPAPRALLEALLEAGAPAVPTAMGRDGHPVLIEAGAVRRRLKEAPLDGALLTARRVPVDWEHTLTNANTPEEWEKVRE